MPIWRIDDRLNHHPCPSALGRGREKRGDQAIGRSRGGVSTKIHVAVDALGNPVRLITTGGQVADVTQGKALISGINTEHVIADKIYDRSYSVDSIEANGAQAVIPPRSNRKKPRDYDKHTYKNRNLVERFLNKVKNCRRIATRYEKTSRKYMVFWQLKSIMVLLA